MPTSTTIAAVAAALACTAGAIGATTTIRYDAVNQGTRSGLGFTLIHEPTDDAGNGDLLYRMFASMTVVFDDSAGTLEFTDFQAGLFEESNFNPGVSGAEIGQISLRQNSTLTRGASTGVTDQTFISGTLALTLDLDGETARDIDIEFKAIDYNDLANRFNSDPSSGFALGLWGATPEVFDGDFTADSLGFDLFAENGTIIPLPSAANLGLLGLGIVGGTTRRRRMTA